MLAALALCRDIGLRMRAALQCFTQLAGRRRLLIVATIHDIRFAVLSVKFYGTQYL